MRFTKIHVTAIGTTALLIASAPMARADLGLRLCREDAKATYRADKLQCVSLAKAGQNGTTLAAYKTLDICENSDGSWKYSGVISVWNEGAIDTTGCLLNDTIQSKESGPVWTTNYTVFDGINNSSCGTIPAGTTALTAQTFPYSVTGAPLAGDIRNVVKVTISNHSGHLGTPWGPEPKATWTGGTPLPCPEECGGCTLTQGYWKTVPDKHIWPDGYNRNDCFLMGATSCTLTWQQVLDTAPQGNGYFILAHQYIAAMLNQANGACVPEGVEATLTSAETWFVTETPASCKKGNDCGLQKDWAAVLDMYNNGCYEEGPGHCGTDQDAQAKQCCEFTPAPDDCPAP